MFDLKQGEQRVEKDSEMNILIFNEHVLFIYQKKKIIGDTCTCGMFSTSETYPASA